MSRRIVHTFESCKAAAAGCASRKAFRHKDRNAYDAARRRGWLDEVCAKGHSLQALTKEQIAQAAKLYPSRNAMARGPHQWAVKVARKNGWLDALPPLFKERVPRKKERVPRKNENATKHPLYNTHRMMKTRCYNKLSPDYKRYGDRGVTVCDRWLNGEDGMTGFECFVLDMGPKPSADYSLDRVDGARPYSPQNCRWATRTTQARNTRNALSPADVCFVLSRPVGMKAMAKQLGCNLRTVKKILRLYGRP